MKVVRTIQNDIEKRLFKGKVVIIYGARQVGKTTLATEILEKYADSRKTLYLNCDDRDIRVEEERIPIFPTTSSLPATLP